jgi:hypothetical protein
MAGAVSAHSRSARIVQVLTVAVPILVILVQPHDHSFLGPIHLSHAALAQLGGDLEVGQRLTDQGEGILSSVVPSRANGAWIRPHDAVYPPQTTDQSVFAGSPIPLGIPNTATGAWHVMVVATTPPFGTRMLSETERRWSRRLPFARSQFFDYPDDSFLKTGLGGVVAFAHDADTVGPVDYD